MSVTTTTRYHGSGRKTITHRLPTPEGDLEVNVYWFESPGGAQEETVFVNTAHDGEGPCTYFRLEQDRILDGWDGHDSTD